MVDLDDAGRRLAAYQAGPTPPISTLHTRARQRRRRRQGLCTLAVTGLAVMVAAVAVVAVRSTSSGRAKPQPVDVVGGPNRPTSLLPVAHPKGWVASDVGRLRVWTPSDWSSCGTTVGGSFVETYTGDFAGGGCLPGGSAPLEIRPAGPTSGLAATSIDGLAVWVGTAGQGAGASRTYDVPSLGVRLVAVGATGRQAALTLGPSALGAVLSTRYPVAVPAGWKTVEWGGVAARVPASWPVRHLTGLPVEDPKQTPSACDLFTSSIVDLGHVHGVCNGVGSAGDPPALWLGNSDGSATTESTNLATGATGTAIVLRYNPVIGFSDDLDLTVTTRHGTVQATLGLGTDPVTAEEILSSLRPAP